MRGFYLLTLFLVLLSASVMADDKKESKDIPETPVTKWLAAETEVVKGLSSADKDSYFILRNKYGLIRAIRIVKDDVGNAVQECGLANPDMQDQMKIRYKAWTNSIDPILKGADAYLKQEIKMQEIVPAKTFKKMLKLNDKAYNYQEDAIEKTVLTDKKTCNKLLRSMDKTEEDLLRLMSEILLPTAQIQSEDSK